MGRYKNLSSTGYTITDEVYDNFGTTKRQLRGWPAFKEDGFEIYLDASPHAGSPLIQDTDYVLEDIDADKTTEYSENIYSKLRMINNDTDTLYITYTSIGSYVNNDVIDNIMFPTEFTNDISAGNQATDLSVYEIGGASEKWDGYRVKVSWTGGNSTYTHAFTGTAYTIGGLAISSWVGNGTGSLTLKLDHDNSDWIILNDPDHVFDKWTTTASSVSYTISRKVNRAQECTIIDSNLRTVSSGSGDRWYTVISYTITSFNFATLERVKDTICLANNQFPHITTYTFTALTTVGIVMFGMSPDWRGYPRCTVVGTY